MTELFAFPRNCAGYAVAVLRCGHTLLLGTGWGAYTLHRDRLGSVCWDTGSALCFICCEDAPGGECGPQDVTDIIIARRTP